MGNQNRQKSKNTDASKARLNRVYGALFLGGQKCLPDGKSLNYGAYSPQGRHLKHGGGGGGGGKFSHFVN
jgi:hypothetical protein